MYRNPSTFEMLFFVALVAVMVASYARDWLSSDPDPLEQARAAYAAGEIDHAEYERRLEFYLDDRNDRIRAVVEDVNGVGETTSKALAREFNSLEELRGADREDLEAVYGVGEETTDAVLERAREGATVPFERGWKRAWMTGYEPSNRTERVLAALGLLEGCGSRRLY